MTLTEIAHHHRTEAGACRMRGQNLQSATTPGGRELAADWEAKAEWHDAAAQHLDSLIASREDPSALDR